MEPSPTTTTTDTEPAAVALVVHDSRDDLERYLDGQLAAARALGGPLIAVDNASRDGSAELLRSRAAAEPDLRVLERATNGGYAAGVNAAFAAAPGRDVLLVNPDVELPEGAALKLAETLAAHADLAIAAPRLLGEDGEAQASARHFPSLGALASAVPSLGSMRWVRRARERYEAPSRSERAVAVDWVVGAAMMIRRAAFDEVGGWDPRFFLYCEDVDFCRRCARAGWRVAYVPEIQVLHRFHRESHAASGSDRARLARRRHLVSHARLFARAPRLLFGGERRPVRPLEAPGP